MDEENLRRQIKKYHACVVSQESGLSRNTVSAFVNRKRKTTKKTINRLTDFLNRQWRSESWEI